MFESSCSCADTLPIRKHLLSILTDLHRLGIKHGDLAPRNVVRRSTGELAIIDFTQSVIGKPCSHVDQKVRAPRPLAFTDHSDGAQADQDCGICQERQHLRRALR